MGVRLALRGRTGCHFGLACHTFCGGGHFANRVPHPCDLMGDGLDKPRGFAFDGFGHRTQRRPAFFLFLALKGDAFLGHLFDLKGIFAENRHRA